MQRLTSAFVVCIWKEGPHVDNDVLSYSLELLYEIAVRTEGGKMQRVGKKEGSRGQSSVPPL